VDRHRRVVESLIISITEYEGNVVDSFTVHVIHGIATATTYTNDLDDAILFANFTEVEYVVVKICHSCKRIKTHPLAPPIKGGE
jgi:hypothetical protein